MASKDFSTAFSLTDEIADIIRQRILKGEYEIGEKIKENQISEELSVSRTPIREAFKQLENEGLIDYIPNRGCYAKGFTRQDVEDIYAVRMALEDLAIKWAATRITEKEIRELEDHCDLMEFYTKKGDVEKVLELNSVFHNTIYNAAQSRFLGQILRDYKEYLDKTRRTIDYTQEYLDGILREHRAILDALKNHDTETALSCMAEHLKASQERMERHWNISC